MNFHQTEPVATAGSLTTVVIAAIIMWNTFPIYPLSVNQTRAIIAFVGTVATFWARHQVVPKINVPGQ